MGRHLHWSIILALKISTWPVDARRGLPHRQ